MLGRDNTPSGALRSFLKILVLHVTQKRCVAGRRMDLQLTFMVLGNAGPTLGWNPWRTREQDRRIKRLCYSPPIFMDARKASLCSSRAVLVSWPTPEPRGVQNPFVAGCNCMPSLLDSCGASRQTQGCDEYLVVSSRAAPAGRCLRRHLLPPRIRIMYTCKSATAYLSWAWV